ncbi:MAG: hypothetical protein P1U77_25075 [Rubripirellula sp.]|nr:hypothetical protein [Rubripirellula sp.]
MNNKGYRQNHVTSEPEEDEPRLPIGWHRHPFGQTLPTQHKHRDFISLLVNASTAGLDFPNSSPLAASTDFLSGAALAAGTAQVAVNRTKTCSYRPTLTVQKNSVSVIFWHKINARLECSPNPDACVTSFKPRRPKETLDDEETTTTKACADREVSVGGRSDARC